MKERNHQSPWFTAKGTKVQAGRRYTTTAGVESSQFAIAFITPNGSNVRIGCLWADDRETSVVVTRAEARDYAEQLLKMLDASEAPADPFAHVDYTKLGAQAAANASAAPIRSGALSAAVTYSNTASPYGRPSSHVLSQAIEAVRKSTETMLGRQITHITTAVRVYADDRTRVCECGSAACGSAAHSPWCPLAEAR